MPRNCGCSADRCTCVVLPGDGIEVDGVGSQNSPYVISADGSGTSIEGGGTESVVVEVNGTGTEDDPYIVTGITASTPPVLNLQVFSGNGTWTKPPQAGTVRVVLLGAGGGGGSGRRGAAGTPRKGGSGGGGGGLTDTLFDGDDLPATVAVTIGAGGPGGVSVTTNSTDGNAGSNGGVTTFGVHAYAQGGRGGGG